MDHLVSSTAYFPPLDWYIAAIRTGHWWLEAEENYQKGGYRNRCRIATANGIKWLSIPLEKGKHQATPIQSVRISTTNDWAREHIQSIRSAYGRAPFFEFYSEDIFQILRAYSTSDAVPTKVLHLWSLNLEIIQYLGQVMAVPIQALPTKVFHRSYSSDTTIDARKGLSIPNLTPAPYPQLFADRHGFQADLSILDLLFCQGPAAGSYLRQQASLA